MKFVDEAVIDVAAGNGGAGCASFRREKHVPMGGPDGGDGGRGGNVIAVTDPSLNTLIDYRYAQAPRGRPWRAGAGRGSISVPPATTRTAHAGGHDRDRSRDRERAGRVAATGRAGGAGQRGDGGFGNLHYKTSTNRSPRQKTPGWPGEQRRLRLELRVLADVGLLGMPNAGKSTLIAAISNARPKIADYPFTTLHPNLGVVRIGPSRSFVVADIPGLIEGAAEGAGLGHQFLRHLQRTRLLWHVVDVAPMDEAVDPVHASENRAGRVAEVR